MQVFGLPGHVIRTSRAASRLIAAKPPNSAATRRRDAASRWRHAMAKGLSAADAAQAVGVPRATLYRWEKRAEPRSKRPRRMRPKTWTPALVQAVERLRLDHPMWGRAKLGPILRRDGFTVSNAPVGRIVAHLVAKGVVEPVPILRRRKGSAARQWRRKHATRLPKGHKPQAPGQLVHVDTLSVNVRPDRSITQFTA